MRKYVQVHSDTSLLCGSCGWLRFWSRLFSPWIWLRPKYPEEYGSRAWSKRLWDVVFCFSLNLFVFGRPEMLSCYLPWVGTVWSAWLTQQLIKVERWQVVLPSLHRKRFSWPVSTQTDWWRNHLWGGTWGCRTGKLVGKRYSAKHRVSRWVGWLIISFNQQIFFE